ncbi:hypothetical protein DOY81_011051 [Sarcophaga bullata]|nr:hypothetical protein DOY81_011051 [Sarcophaga bullata]
MAASPTGGVKPMAIAGRMVRERERLVGMSDEERAWRHQRAWNIRFGPGKVLYSAPSFMQPPIISNTIRINLPPRTKLDWTRKGGWRVITSRKACNPGDEGYPDCRIVQSQEIMLPVVLNNRPSKL